MVTKDGRTYREHLYRRLIESNVPDHLHEGLVEYLASRRPVGRFLTSTLSNNLMESCSRADLWTRPYIANVVMFLLNYAPADSWGSEHVVGEWLEKRDLPVPEIFE